MKKKIIKTCLICSVGGHLHQLQIATKDLDMLDSYWVMYPTKHTRTFLKEKKHYFVTNLIFQKKITYLANFIQSFWHLLKERPQVVISTGAGVAVPTIFLAKKIFKSKIIYISSAANVSDPSRTPIWAYKYSDLFLVQWDSLEHFFPNSKNIGVL